MKELSDSQPPPGKNDCSTLSSQIRHAERVVKLYEAWDAKWKPGAHAQKINDWKQRLKNLKDEHRKRCAKSMSIKKKLADIIKKYERHPEFLGINISDPNQLGAVDDTLLHIAARSGDMEGVEILIAAGARVNAIGDLGNTALHQAAMMGQINIVRRLLKLGANPGIRNEFCQTARDVAKLGGKQEVVEILREAESTNRDEDRGSSRT